jgi:hypothetical protein
MPSARPFDEALARKSRAEDIKGPFQVEDFVDRHLSQIVVQDLPNFDAIRTAIQGLSGNVAADRLTEVLNSISDNVGSTVRSVAFINFYWGSTQPIFRSRLEIASAFSFTSTGRSHTIPGRH